MGHIVVVYVEGYVVGFAWEERCQSKSAAGASLRSWQRSLILLVKL